ncbi:hypothetical protein J437_LFUL009681 [Ladona fulva]|uniref:Uncharacterized protein n=1 Tax=Ladona fulva TaxID=123851 RepID=A0A8K0K6P3_LADFU|nr:hypothetical protein J437_LFUL009681 [Ladona fulva]
MAGNDRKSSSKQTHASDGLGNKSAFKSADPEISGIASRSLRSHLKLSPLVKEVIKSDSSKNSEKSPKSSLKKRNALKVVKPNKNRVRPYATRSLSSITFLRSGKKKFDRNVLRLKRKQVKKKSTTDVAKDIDVAVQDEKQDSKSRCSPDPTLEPRKLRSRHFLNEKCVTPSKTNVSSIKAETLKSSFSSNKIKRKVISDVEYPVEIVTLGSVPSGSQSKISSEENQSAEESTKISEDSSPDRQFPSKNSRSDGSDEPNDHILELEGCPAEGGGVILCPESAESPILRFDSTFTKLTRSESLLNINSEQESEPNTSTDYSVSPLTVGESLSFEEDLTIESDQALVSDTTSNSKSLSEKGFSNHFKTLIANNASESDQLTDSFLNFVNGEETGLGVKILPGTNAAIPSLVSSANNNEDREKSLNGLEEMAPITISSDSSLLEYDEVRRKVDKASDPMEVDVCSDSSTDAALNTETVIGEEVFNLKIAIQASLVDIVKKGLLDVSDSSRSRIEEAKNKEDPENLVVISSSNSPITVNERDDVTEEIDIGRESVSKKSLSDVVLHEASDSNERDNAPEETFTGGEIGSEMPSSKTAQQETCNKIEIDISCDESVTPEENDSSSKIVLKEVNSDDDSAEEIVIDGESITNESCSSITLLEISDTNKKDDEIVEEICDGEKLSGKIMSQETSDASEADDDSEGELVIDEECCSEKVVNRVAQKEVVDTGKEDDSIEEMATAEESLSGKSLNEMVQQETNEGDDSIKEMATDKDNLPENLFDEMVQQEANETDGSIKEMTSDKDDLSEKPFNEILQLEANEGDDSIEEMAADKESFSENPSDEIVQQEATDTNEGYSSDEEMAMTTESISEKSSSDILQQESSNCPSLSEDILNPQIQENKLEEVLDKTAEEKALDVSLAVTVTEIQPEYNEEKSCAESNSLEGSCTLQKDKEIESPLNEVKEVAVYSETAANVGEDSAEQLAVKETMLNALGLQSSRAASMVKAPLRQSLPPIPSRTSGTLKTIIKVPRMVDKRRARNRVKLVLKKDKPEKEKLNSLQDQRFLAPEESEGIARDAESMSYDHHTDEDPFAFQMFEESNVSGMGAWNSQMTKQKSKSLGNSRKYMGNDPMSQLDLNHMNFSRNLIDGMVGCSSTESHQDLLQNFASDGSSNSGRSTQQGSSDGAVKPPLVIPEKSASFSIHPERLCHDVCCVRGCSLPAHHLVRRKWLNRLKRTISKLLPLEITPSPPNQQPSLHAPLCSRHYYCLEFYSVCGICKRKLSRNNMYPVGREVHELNSLLMDDSIPVTLTGKIFLCKMCRYYSGIRLKYRDKKMLSKGHKSFFDGYRKRIWHYLGIQKMDPSEVSAPIEIPKKRKKSKSTEEDSCQEAEQNKHLKLLEDPSKQSGESNSESNSESSSDNSLHKPYISRMPTKIRFKLGNVSIEHLENADPSKKGSKTQMAETVTQSSCSFKKPESSKPKKRSSSDSVVEQPEFPGVDKLGLNASFLFHGTDDSKEWEKCTTTLQFDAKTKKLWKSLYYPYGNLSSFIRHLVIMERNWRNGDLVLAPNASSQAVNYVNSVQNRIAAYEGSVPRPPPKSTVPKHTVTRETGQKPVPVLIPLPPAPGTLTSVPQKVTKDSLTVLPTTASTSIDLTNPQCPTNIATPITAQLIPINTATNFLPITPSQIISLDGPNSYFHIGSVPGLVHQINNPYSCVQFNQESVSEKDLIQKPIESPVIDPAVPSSSSTLDLHISNVRSLAGEDGEII